MSARPRKGRRAKQRLSPEEARRRRESRRFKSDIRTVFANAGFVQVPTRDVTVVVAGRKSDFDSVFVFENVVAIVEDTELASGSIGDHLRKKVDFFEHLRDHRVECVEMLRKTFPRFDDLWAKSNFEAEEVQLRFVYASKETVADDYQTRFGQRCQLLSYPSLQYFVSLSKTIRRSARFELCKFLGVALDQIGSHRSAVDASRYSALQLPHIPSGFPKGHKLVSFLVDPATLLERAYVLRSDSWRDEEALYQRLLIRGKIASMRKYLVDERRVFINNIIVTLRNDAHFEPSETSDRVDGSASRISTGYLTIPRRFDAIGIIDGQHRVYAYHEGDDSLDETIGRLRSRQHLLVTGIIYPKSISDDEAEAFEAKLFLEINDKQKRVGSDLKQAIELILSPYSDVAIAKALLHRLGSASFMAGVFALHFFDTGKLKTASIVSYGLRHIVSIDGKVSLFKRWAGPGKDAVRQKRDRDALDRYIKYCGTQLSTFVGAFKASQEDSLWTTNRKSSRLLTTTTINGLIFCMRLLIEQNRLGDFESYKRGFAKLDLDFRPGKFSYKSSHWRQLGKYIFDCCFA